MLFLICIYKEVKQQIKPQIGSYSSNGHKRRETLCQHEISLLWQWGFLMHKHTVKFRSTAVARGVLTPPAVSRAGIKIWHPQRFSVDTSWAWSQRKCLSPPLSTPAFPLLQSRFCRPSLLLTFSFHPWLLLYSSNIFLQQFSLCSPWDSPNRPPLNSSPTPSFYSHLKNLFQWHNTDFLPTFLPSLINISVAQ